MNKQIKQYNEPVKSLQNHWIIVVSIVITALVVGGVVYVLQSSRLKSSEEYLEQQITLLQNQNQQGTQPPTNQQQAKQAQKIVYNNSQHGFSLTFPQTWKGYIAENRTLNFGSFGTSDSVDFGFSVQDSLFNVSIHTKNQWQQIKSEEGLTPTYLGENSQYVFGYATAQDAVNDIMVARMTEVQEVVKTFKVTK
jgi:type II secretory pathway pseudopilin PulG